MKRVRVTLSIPARLRKQIRAYAPNRKLSTTDVIMEALRLPVDQEKSERAQRRFLERIRNAPDRGTEGNISWSQEDLHRSTIRDQGSTRKLRGKVEVGRQFEAVAARAARPNQLAPPATYRPI